MLGVILNQQTWLPLTQGWIHTQAAYLPAHVVPYVVCGATDNLPQFELPRLHAWSRLPWRERLRVLAGGAALLGSGFSRRAALMACVARRHGAQIVHSHFGYTGYHAARVVRRLGLRHVVTFYGVDMSALPRQDPRWRERYRFLFERVDQVLCEGPRMAAGVAALGCPPEKLRVHHLGVALGDLPFRVRAWQPGEPLRVLIAASFREKKGIPYALEALARVRERVSLEITVVGDAGSDAQSKAEKVRILEVVANCRLAPHVRFVGYQPWRWLMEEAYRNHVFMSPSVTAADGDTEGGSPVGLIEMAATGMPVVSSRHADIPEVIEHGVGGWLAAERDVDELEQCLRRLIDAPQGWEALARAARGRIEREFNAQRQGAALGEIYERVCRV
jgi:colanic acid/amylovoran biosynthesis glycosyltransferase